MLVRPPVCQGESGSWLFPRVYHSGICSIQPFAGRRCRLELSGMGGSVSPFLRQALYLGGFLAFPCPVSAFKASVRMDRKEAGFACLPLVSSGFLFPVHSIFSQSFLGSAHVTTHLECSVLGQADNLDYMSRHRAPSDRQYLCAVERDGIRRSQSHDDTGLVPAMGFAESG